VRHLDRRLVAGFVLAACVCALPVRPVLSQVDDVASIVSQAERDARERRYEAAIAGFLRAYEMSGQPDHLYSVAALYLGRLNAPLQAWEYAMRLHEAARTEADRADAQALAEKAEAGMARTHGKVVATVLPAGASLWWDERSDSHRVTRPQVFLAPGRHRFVSRADGHEDGEAWVEVRPGKVAEVRIELKALPATLSVDCDAPDCRVTLDGTPAGTAPVVHRVPPGAHLVRCEAPGREPRVERVDLKPGASLSVHAELAAVATPPASAAVPASAAAPARQQVATSPAPPRRGFHPKWGWIAAGGAAAFVATGSVLYVLGRDQIRSAGGMAREGYSTNEAFDAEFDSRISGGKAKAYAGYAMWGLGGAAVGAALYLFLAPAPGARAVVVPTPSGMAAHVAF